MPIVAEHEVTLPNVTDSADVKQTLSGGQRTLVRWMKKNFVSSTGSYVRLCDAVDAVKNNETVFNKVTGRNITPGQKNTELMYQLRTLAETALGPGKRFVIGTTANKCIYYDRGTDVGKKLGKGVKVPGWHVTGFRLRVPE